MKNVSDKSSRRVGTWSINGRRLIVSEIDRRERYYDVQRHPSEGSLEKWSKLLIRSHKITRDCAANGIIRSSTAGNSDHSKLRNDYYRHLPRSRRHNLVPSVGDNFRKSARRIYTFVSGWKVGSNRRETSVNRKLARIHFTISSGT